ncbi:hypothetical protein HanRHA438_Chr06g0268621 [Helianthus annuus]|nr:hypothetical protein HanRHA438_Chr06g0268621 [Helianthus annuus]
MYLTANNSLVLSLTSLAALKLAEPTSFNGSHFFSILTTQHTKSQSQPQLKKTLTKLREKT